MAVGLGAALLGVVGGLWGAFSLERQREARRRLGLIAALSMELSENAVKGNLLVRELKKGPGAAGPLWDPGGPVSADFWHSHVTDAGSFLPFDLLIKMRMAYTELELVRRFGDDPATARSPASAIAFLEEWVGLLQEANGELLTLPEGEAILSKMQAAEDFVRGRNEARLRRAPD